MKNLEFDHWLRWSQSIAYLRKQSPILKLSNKKTGLLNSLIHGFDVQVDLEDCPHLPKKNKGYRLGKEMEWVLLSILAQNPRVVNLHHSIQRIDPINPARTLGEIDFLIELQDFGWIQLEFALKFYLYNHNLQEFIGPAKIDRLSIKYEKLINRQLKLTPPDSLGINIQERIPFVAGILFYPTNNYPSQTSIDWINPEHHKAKFYLLEELDLLDKNSQYLLLSKPFWTSSLFPKNFKTIQREQIVEHMDNPTLLPSCFAQVVERETHFEEVCKFFVVPSDWVEKKL